MIPCLLRLLSFPGPPALVNRVKVLFGATPNVHFRSFQSGGLLLESRALIGPEFLQLVPGFFSTDYATASAALQHLIEMATYEELAAHTFYYLVGIAARVPTGPKRS